MLVTRGKRELSMCCAIENSIKALEKTSWVPVSERLPEPQKDEDKDFSEWVMIISYNGIKNYKVGRAHYCFSNKKWYAETFDCGKVIAWMPLPEPYKIEREVLR